MRLVVERASGETVKGVVGAQEAEISTIGIRLSGSADTRLPDRFLPLDLDQRFTSPVPTELQIRYLLERLPERQTGK